MAATEGEERKGMKEGGSYVVLVGDILESRLFRDQRTLFSKLQQQFNWVNERVPAAQGLSFTVGDEFQAAYLDINKAFKAAILLRLRFKAAKITKEKDVGSGRKQDIRMGLSYGKVSVYREDSAPFGQSGEAWWSARNAIEQVENPKNQPRIPSSWRTKFHCEDRQLDSVANSFWLAVDQVIYKMDRTDSEITLKNLNGLNQTDIAAKLGLTQPSVSRRSKQNGVFTVLKILAELDRAVQ